MSAGRALVVRAGASRFSPGRGSGLQNGAISRERQSIGFLEQSLLDGRTDSNEGQEILEDRWEFNRSGLMGHGKEIVEQGFRERLGVIAVVFPALLLLFQVSLVSAADH